MAEVKQEHTNAPCYVCARTNQPTVVMPSGFRLCGYCAAAEEWTSTDRDKTPALTPDIELSAYRAVMSEMLTIYDWDTCYSQELAANNHIRAGVISRFIRLARKP